MSPSEGMWGGRPPPPGGPPPPPPRTGRARAPPDAGVPRGPGGCPTIWSQREWLSEGDTQLRTNTLVESSSAHRYETTSNEPLEAMPVEIQRTSLPGRCLTTSPASPPLPPVCVAIARSFRDVLFPGWRRSTSAGRVLLAGERMPQQGAVIRGPDRMNRQAGNQGMVGRGVGALRELFDQSRVELGAVLWLVEDDIERPAPKIGTKSAILWPFLLDFITIFGNGPPSRHFVCH